MLYTIMIGISTAIILRVVQIIQLKRCGSSNSKINTPYAFKQFTCMTPVA